MYSIFIADDNELARQALKKSINWDKLDCELCGEASNGNEALDSIKKELPDIVLMDIKMPGLSGMDVITQTIDLDKKIIYIMVTAYDDFEFMRKGMQIGVFDYILKPISDDELQDVLEKAVGCVRNMKKNEQITQSLNKQHYITETEKLFHDAVNGVETSAEKFSNLMKKQCRLHDYLLMLINPENNLIESDIETFIDTQRQIIKECNQRYSIYATGIWRKEGYVILINFGKSMFVREYNLLSLRIAKTIFNENQKISYPVYITISRTSSSFCDISKLFAQTIFCKNGRFFLENNKVIHYESLMSRSVSEEYIKMKSLEELYKACRESRDDIVECMDEFLDQFSMNEIYDISYVRNIMIQAVIMMVYITREIRPDDIELRDADEYVRELSDIGSLQNTYAFMRNFAENVQKIICEDHYLSAQAKAILDYINIHYSESISLQETADYMGLSGTHISRILKKETGETFTTYINKIRIKESIKLLRSGQYKVYEVADRVGYSNYAYFYQIFKKNTGVSPKDYV